MTNLNEGMIKIMSYPEFLEDLDTQAGLQAEAQIREAYIKRPGYKKNDWRKYRKTEEYQSRYQETLTDIQKEFCDKTEDELKAIYKAYCEKQEKLLADMQEEKDLEKEWEIWTQNNESSVIKIMYDIVEMMKKESVSLIEKDILSKKQSVPRIVYYGRWCTDVTYEDLTEENLQDYLDECFETDAVTERITHLYQDQNITEIICEKILESMPEIQKFDKYEIEPYFFIADIVSENLAEWDIINYVEDYFIEKKILELLSHNIYYSDLIKNIEKEAEMRKLIKAAMLDKIPDNPVDLFPLARQMTRKVFLHVGPTNSGKTHDAMEALKSADSGIYLAPLRLMAYEGYETLKDAGIPVCMETGEEHKKMDGAKHYSRTMELFNPIEEFDVAVIDEAQMITDPGRGGAWTNAILGIRAKEVHICMAPEAETLIRKMLEACGDNVKVIRHERKTDLIVQSGSFSFPSDVEQGDALIVFSKKNVICCAAELQRKGYKCSLIYGSLPYDVRQNEVDKFLSGETDFVVSTDAIGMGMNLPVRRIVFLETEKFDGISHRKLRDTEVKQIAGRAGRFGLYEAGYCTSQFDRKFIRRNLEAETHPIHEAVLAFQESLIMIDGKLSSIMEQWNSAHMPSGYSRADISDMLYLVQVLETMTEEKRLIYSYASIPFDLKNEELLYLWKELCRKVCQKETIQYQDYCGETDEDSLNALEALHHRYDLLYNFARREQNQDAMDFLMVKKQAISEKIMEILKTKKLQGKTCRECGKALPWNFPYPMCDSCHNKLCRYQDWY